MVRLYTHGEISEVEKKVEKLAEKHIATLLKLLMKEKGEGYKEGYGEGYEDGYDEAMKDRGFVREGRREVLEEVKKKFGGALIVGQLGGDWKKLEPEINVYLEEELDKLSSKDNEK